MPINLTQMSNPWGRTQVDARGNLTARALEAQRSDLFTVDFSVAYDAIRTVFDRQSDNEWVADLLRQLPTREELPYLVQGIDFGESRVAVTHTKRHEVPVPFPGNEEPYGQVTVTFLQEVSGETALYASKVMAFLRAWRALVRAGRGGITSGEVSLDLLSASSDGAGLIPHFRHTFRVQMWRGATPQLSATELFTGVKPGNDLLPQLGLELATQWNIRGAWVLAIQPNSLAQASPTSQMIRATFAAEAITEGFGGQVQVGQAFAV